MPRPSTRSAAWDANYFDALSNPSGGITKLVVMPAQFKANDLTDIEGTLRKYSDMDFRLLLQRQRRQLSPRPTCPRWLRRRRSHR